MVFIKVWFTFPSLLTDIKELVTKHIVPEGKPKKASRKENSEATASCGCDHVRDKQ